MIARWAKVAVMGIGDDVLTLTVDDRGRTLIRRRPGRGQPFKSISIPTGETAIGCRFSERPTLAQAEAYALANGYERVG